MALSRHHAALNRPLSVQEIVQTAEYFKFDISQPLQRWIRAGKMLLTEAAICEQDGELQMAYLYLYRHAQLVLDRLPQHPDYKDPRYRPDLAAAQKALQRNMQKLEQWRPRINQEYERYTKAIERRNLERQRVQEQRDQDLEFGLRRQSLASDEGVDGNDAKPLLANEHRELAVDLAHREIRRRDATRRSTSQAGISPDTVASRRKGIIVGPASHDDPNDGPTQNDGVREVGRQLYESGRQQLSHPNAHAPGKQSYHYPSVPAKEGAMNWHMSALQPQAPQSQHNIPPLRPAKAAFDSHAPAPPAKTSAAPLASPSPPPSKYTFKPAAYTESGSPLRTVLLPPDLRTTFLNLAHLNTSRNLETCGILCGTVISNALFINHLIIPDQTSSSDTCDTTESGDNDLFDFCDSHDLLVCGWIHTHPSQSCFLSSRDLHTSSGYQVMLPEAIAIVCAPRHNPDWGIFRLTDPPGLQHVLECRKPGLFHPHEESNIYTDALRPGHVVEGPGLKFEVVDLRKKR